MWKSEDTYGNNLGCGRNVTLSFKNTVKWGYAIRALISPTFRAKVMVTRKAIFISQEGNSGSKWGLVRHLSINLRFQTKVRCVICGKIFHNPLRNLTVVWWANTKKPSTGKWKAVIAAKCTLVEFKDNSDILSSRVQSSIFDSDEDADERCLRSHQWLNLVHFCS